MQMSWSVLGTWAGLFLFSLAIIFISYKFWHVPPKDQKRINKSIIYSFLSGFIVFLIPIILEKLFPLPENCSALQKDWLVECGGKYINWRYIQTMTIIAYFFIVFFIWVIWDLFYGKLYKLPIQLALRFSRMIRGAIVILGLLMMLPLAWLRNFLLGL